MLYARRSAVCSRSHVCRVLCALFLSLTCFCLELEACTKANEELQKLREVAEVREADHRRETLPGAGGSARYDPEIICYVLFVMFFGLG